MPKAPFEDLRKRAFDLAEAGQFFDWLDVADALIAEGFHHAERRLRAHPILLLLLNARCLEARERNAQGT